MKKVLSTMMLLLMTTFLVSCIEKEELVKMEATPDSKVPYLDDIWVAVWADEFDGDTLDMTKWSYEIDGGGGGNNELQYYTNNNATVKDGILTITAKKDDQGHDYTSSRIVTRGKGDFTYGRIQASIKVPDGRGTWPAFWMMPTRSPHGIWPRSGEIDIMEHVGYDNQMIHNSIHTLKYHHSVGTGRGNSIKIPTATTEFHLYEIIWEPGIIMGYVDGELYSTFKYTAGFEREVEFYEVFPFYYDFFIILNLAIGGDWGGQQGVDDSLFPHEYEIDFVRVYQKDYNYYDKAEPSQPSYVQESAYLKNSIYWRESTDDMGVELYNIYVDGELHTTSPLSQVVLKRLEVGQTYEVTIEAVDFTGKVSELSEPISFTYQ